MAQVCVPREAAKHAAPAVSASAPEQGQAAAPKNPNKETHIFDKTRICKFFLKGQCARGEGCTFAHGKVQLQQKPDFFRTQWCIDYLKSGACRLGVSCKFAHTVEELRSANIPGKRSAAAPAAPPAPARRGACEETFQAQLDSAQRQVMELQARLSALRALASSTAAQQPERPGPRAPLVPGLLLSTPGTPASATKVSLQKEAAHSALCLDLAFSRQSTQDTETSVVAFSRQTSDWTDDWMDSAPTTPVAAPLLEPRDEISAQALQMAAERGLQLFVRHTFLDVEPLSSTAPARRGRSAPPRDRC